MTRRSLERRIESLIAEESDCKGFHHVAIGTDGEDPARSGYFGWDAAQGVYVNAESGHTLPADAKPESRFDYEISYNSGNP